MDTKLTVAVIAVAIGLSVDASGESRARYGGGLSASLLSEPVNVDPVGARSHAEVSVSSMVFDGLYRIGANGDPVPQLAVDMPVYDGLLARIHLASPVYFHSGVEVTATDVVASLTRLAASDAGWLMAPVAGVREEAGDVVFDLRRATPELALILSSPHAAITRGGVAATPSEADGTGPYRLRAIRRSSRSVELVAWDRYFAGPAFVGQVVLRWFEEPADEAKLYEAGGTNMSFRGAVAFSGHVPTYKTEDAEAAATLLSYIGFGKKTAVTKSVEFRQAVSRAIDRGSFRNVGSGEQVVPTLHGAAVAFGGPPISRADLKPNRREAARLVQGMVANIGDLELIIDRHQLDDKVIGNKVVFALHKIGIKSHVTELDSAVFARRVRRGECDLFIGQLAAPAASAELQLAGVFAAGGDDWAARKLRDAPLRLDDALAAFSRRLPVVPLFHRGVRVHHQDNVKIAVFDAISRLSYADLFLYGSPKTP